jgi:phosphoglycolate phosphatase
VLSGKFPLAVKAVGFDLDGTLMDTAGDLVLAGNMMREELGLSPISREVILSFIGKGIRNLVRRAISFDAVVEPSDDDLRRAVEIYERHYRVVLHHSSVVYPDVIAGLDLLQQAGFPLACITNKSARFTTPLLEFAELANRFEITLSGDSLPKKKPDPLPFQHVCEQFGIAAHEFLYIGDSVNDTEAARAAGSPVFVVAYGYHQRGDASELEADAVVSGLVEAAKLIENSGR